MRTKTRIIQGIHADRVRGGEKQGGGIQGRAGEALIHPFPLVAWLPGLLVSEAERASAVEIALITIKLLMQLLQQNR